MTNANFTSQSDQSHRGTFDLSDKKRGSYLNPRNWNERGVRGDIYYYPEYRYYFEFKQSGNPADYNWYFPTRPQHNDCWRFVSGINLGFADWMAVIPDDTSLACISIPGTHDSCTYTHYGADKSRVRTQNWNIVEQLNNGIRFLDFRCGKADNILLGMYHDTIYLDLDFSRVLSDCVNFLKQHPLETLLVRIKREGPEISDQEFIARFSNVIRENLDYIWQEDRIPALGEVRQKIVILSEVSGLKGIQWPSLVVEDDYLGEIFESYIEKKESLIKDNLIKCINQNYTTNYNIYVTFASINPGTDIFETNYRISEKINPYIFDLLWNGIEIDSRLGNSDVPSLGIIPMDFPDDSIKTIHSIIKFNRNTLIDRSITTSIFNTEYNNYIYASSLRYDESRRKVFGWETGEQVSQGQWKIVAAHDDYCYIFNMHYKEFMYAVSSVKDNRRTIATWVPGIMVEIDDAFLWNITSYGDGTYIIQNKMFNEYFYATSLNDGDNRRDVACWHPGNLVNQAFFKMLY